MRTWTLLLVLAAVLVCAPGCNGDDSDTDNDGQSCTLNTDCPYGSRCLNQVCTTLECSADTDCLGGEYCNIQTGQTTGQCTEYATDGDDPTDGDAPDGDEPVGDCISGDWRCQGSVLEQCQLQNNRYDWGFYEDCEFGCEQNACAEDPDGDQDAPEEESTLCEPGTERCYTNQVQHCEEDGSAWRIEDPCLNGTCVQEDIDAYCGPKIICQDGQQRCDPQGTNAVATCNTAGTEWTLMPCAASQTCINGICEGGSECTPNRYRCTNEMKRVEQCNSQGTGWVLSENCGDGETCVCGSFLGTDCIQAACITDTVCVPFSERRCSGNTVQQCNFDGKGWSDWKDCEDDEQTCQDGACI